MDALPWVYAGDGCIRDANGDCVIDDDGLPDAETGEAIVRAVNSHVDLVQALRQALPPLRTWLGERSDLCAIIESALAKASADAPNQRK